MLKHFFIVFLVMASMVHALTEDVATVRQTIKLLKADFLDEQALASAEKCFAGVKETPLKDAHIVWRFLGALMMTGNDVLQGLHDSIVKSGYDLQNGLLSKLGYSWSADKKMNAADHRILSSRFYVELAKEKARDSTPSFTTPEVWQSWQGAAHKPVAIWFSAQAGSVHALYWSALFGKTELPDLWRSLFGEVVEASKKEEQKPLPDIASAASFVVMMVDGGSAPMPKPAPELPPKKLHDTGNPRDVLPIADAAAVVTHIGNIKASVQSLGSQSFRDRFDAYGKALDELAGISAGDRALLTRPYQKAFDALVTKTQSSKDGVVQEAKDDVKAGLDAANTLLVTLNAKLVKPLGMPRAEANNKAEIDSIDAAQGKLQGVLKDVQGVLDQALVQPINDCMKSLDKRKTRFVVDDVMMEVVKDLSSLAGIPGATLAADLNRDLVGNDTGQIKWAVQPHRVISTLHGTNNNGVLEKLRSALKTGQRDLDQKDIRTIHQYIQRLEKEAKRLVEPETPQQVKPQAVNLKKEKQKKEEAGGCC